jgi:hypothetical protein
MLCLVNMKSAVGGGFVVGIVAADYLAGGACGGP